MVSLVRGACLIVVALAIATESAQATSTVVGTAGGVVYWGDNAQHKLRVRTSQLDLPEVERTLNHSPPDISATPTDVSHLQQLNAVEATMQTTNPTDPEVRKSLLDTRTVVAGAATLPPVFKPWAVRAEAALDTALVAYDDLAEGAKLVKSVDQVSVTLYDSLKDVKEVIRVTRVLATVAEVELERRAIVFGKAMLKADDVVITELVRLIATNPSQATGMPGFVGKLRRYLQASHAYEIFKRTKNYSALLKAVPILGYVMLSVQAADAIESVVEGDSVLIEDRTGEPIVAANLPGGFCDNWRPKGQATKVLNVVQCKVVTLGFGSQLGIWTGNGDDTVDLREVDDEADVIDGTTVITGGGSDSFYGSPLGDKVMTGAGDDPDVQGRGEDDWIWGGTGNDRLYGGYGSDRVQGGDGHDLVSGGPDDDLGILWPGSALAGDAGNDVIVGGRGSDDMNGGEGRDTVFAKESDFLFDLNDPSKGQAADELDAFVSCGPSDGTGRQYAKTSGWVDTFGPIENSEDCSSPASPRFTPTGAQLVRNMYPVNGLWPWFE